MSDVQNLLKSAKNGDRRSLSRLMTSIESGNIPNLERKQCWTLGITGPPGVGKSTLIGQMISHWLVMGHRVAILALDPTSPVSGGSFLADRVRMDQADLSDEVFVRSIASGSNTGGIPNYLGELCFALSECGWTRILIETIGTGQSDVRIFGYAQRVLLLDGPDRGDIIQAEKAGILELADIIAVNKSDLPGSESAVQGLKLSLGLSENEKRKVHLVSARDGNGIADLISTIESCEIDDSRRKIRMREMLISNWDSLLLNHSQIDLYLEKLCSGSITVNDVINSMITEIIPRGE